jgi:hypothetical protein
VGVTVRNLGSTVPVSPYVQDLRNANIHAFCFLPLSQHALVLFEFPRQVSWCPGGCFALFLPRVARELIVGRNGAHGGPRCQDTKIDGSPSLRGKQSKNWSGGREQRDCPSLDLVRKTIKSRRTNLAKPAYHRRDCHQRSNSGAIRPGRVAYCEPGMACKWNDQG